MILSGVVRLGRDAEVRDARGTPVCNLAGAFEYGKKGPDGKRRTQWVDAALWGAQAESLAPYLLKGYQVMLTLRDPHIEEFEARDGTRSKLCGDVIHVQLLSQKDGGQAAQQQNRAPAPAPAPAPAQRQAAKAPPEDFDEDSVPF